MSNTWGDRAEQQNQVMRRVITYLIAQVDMAGTRVSVPDREETGYIATRVEAAHSDWLIEAADDLLDILSSIGKDQ